MSVRAPAPRPCGSCPYRRDVASGVWARSEYEKLPPYDGQTGEQPPSIFACHQQDGRVCAGWAAVHDMDENLALRIAAADGAIAPEDAEAVLSYETDVPLFATGTEAAEHGLRDLERPRPDARRVIFTINRKRTK